MFLRVQVKHTSTYGMYVDSDIQLKRSITRGNISFPFDHFGLDIQRKAFLFKPEIIHQIY